MSIYILLDAAQVKSNMHKVKELSTSHKSLYRDSIEKNLSDLAPYLFKAEKNSDFENWYKENGWGNAWGLFVQSQFDFEIVYRHFQKFLIIQTEDGQELYFRFYDPRVLRIFLPTCDAKQLQEFFGPIKQFICEDEDAAFALIFSFNGNKLITEKVAADAIFPAIKKANATTAVLQTRNNDETDKTNSATQQEIKPKRRFFY